MGLLLSVLAAAALASTPIPAGPIGAGTERTAGGGIMLGKPFSARYALAQLDTSFNQVEIYLFPNPVACDRVFFTSPPYVKVTLDTHGSPILLDRPSPQNGVAFVQADFHPANAKIYFAIQPGVELTLTRVDPRQGRLWHGRLKVRRQRSEGHVFSYAGTFAARWCGKD